MVRDEYAGIEQSLDSNVTIVEHDDTSDDTVVDGQRGIKHSDAITDVTPSSKSMTPSSSASNSSTTTEAGEEQHVIFDPSSAETITLRIAGVDVGAGFRELQREAASIVNNKNKKLTLERLPMFMACNYILHLDAELPGVDEDDMDKVRESLHVDLMSVSKETALLCSTLNDELAKSGWVRSKENDCEEESIRCLYQQLSWKLPRQYIAFRLNNEDTHAHASLDALMSMVFPVSQRNIELSWANRASIGSKDRRGDANKPDSTVLKDTFEVGFVEIKPPREERHEKAFLEDQWALATFAKDAIDYHLRHGRPFKTIPCLQVFGFQLILYKLEFMSGLYIWQQLGVAYLPRDMNDRGVIAGSMALLRTFKHYVKNIETKQYIHTPPKKSHDEDLSDEFRPRVSNLTPKSRPFFPSTH